MAGPIHHVLGIETSCDETSAAVVRDGRTVLSNVVSSQTDLHARFRGVVPEIAARAHVERVVPVVEEALDRARLRYADLDAVAVTSGPGLVGSLVVGVMAAKSLAMCLDRPLAAVDHIEAHAVSGILALSPQDSPPWPAIALVVSGGHTSLYLVRSPLEIKLLGQTLDDAAGEAFDKVAAILELGYPGGPLIDRLAQEGDSAAINFPRMRVESPVDFSFSGLKTAVLYKVYGSGSKYGTVSHLSHSEKADVAASFQAAVVEPLVERTLLAARSNHVDAVLVGGGVAANRALRAALQTACAAAGLRLILTPTEFCTDNAAMVAYMGYERLLAGLRDGLDIEVRSGLRRPEPLSGGRSTT